MSSYVSVTDNTYTKDDITETEAKIIHALNFDILKTTPYQYLTAILGNLFKTNVGSLCQYLIELCNLEYLTSVYTPSVLVVTCLEIC